MDGWIDQWMDGSSFGIIGQHIQRQLTVISQYALDRRIKQENFRIPSLSTWPIQIAFQPGFSNPLK